MNVSDLTVGGNTNGHAGRGRFRSAADLATNPDLMEPPEVTIPPFAVAGRVVLLTMGPKGGKSTTAAGLIAQGTRDWGVRCGLVTLDEALPDSLQRLSRFDADFDLTYLADTFDPATLAEDVAAEGLKVLVVDHLGSLAERSPDFGAGSQGDSVLWARLLSPFTVLAREAEMAIVLLDQSRRSDNSYSGSAYKAGGVDILCEMNPDGGGLVCSPRGRVFLPPFRVDLDPSGSPVFSKYEPRNPSADRSNSALAEAHRRGVVQVLHSAGPAGLRAVEWQRGVAEAVGLGKTAFYDIRRALLDAGEVKEVARRYHVTPGSGSPVARMIEPPTA